MTPSQPDLLPCLSIEVDACPLPKSQPGKCQVLHGLELNKAIGTILLRHYTRSVPSGKSHWLEFDGAIIVWSIPANSRIAQFLFGWPANVWELSRLWAPDGHRRNLLTEAIAEGVKLIKRLEAPDALVSYADPNIGHSGRVYRAASWIYHGQSEETRMYARGEVRVSHRSFHCGPTNLTKAQVESDGWTELHEEGKHRFIKLLSRKAKLTLKTMNSQ